ncbi:sarcosine dehydrogenase, mitochondrial isoform X6 [Desmodus rotundus]|uniref:sarcosine dehydrogenase, mitochondrial isoform X6 n=1 Tax=Desmodus rotundus TaxID=9430 RepID=UPI002380F5AE|nr:sarcosine dehydrogenase, mitochondrial isoform X6 [Desmodus rotundus]
MGHVADPGVGEDRRGRESRLMLKQLLLEGGGTWAAGLPSPGGDPGLAGDQVGHLSRGSWEAEERQGQKDNAQPTEPHQPGLGVTFQGHGLRRQVCPLPGTGAAALVTLRTGDSPHPAVTRSATSATCLSFPIPLTRELSWLPSTRPRLQSVFLDSSVHCERALGTRREPKLPFSINSLIDVSPEGQPRLSPQLPVLLQPAVPMASLSRALGAAASRPRRSRAQGLGLRTLTSGASPTTEKSVPYQRTLKEAPGPSVEAQGPSRPLPSTASVVVVGGGSLGCQTLYHLAKLGVSGAILLERERLTSGTTWHTAGLLWQLRPSDVEVELLAHTRRVVSHDLPAETGLHTGWIQNGGLFIASNRQRLDEYKRLMSLGKAYGVESHVLSPAETKELYPLMNVDDLYGTLYVPHDGTMDPAGTCSTLARAASARGAQVIENCPVTGIRVRTDDFGVRRVAAVETQHGSIQTPCVVNCAGVWADAVGRMAGVKVPLVAMHHAYVVTERIEGIQNMPNVRDHDASVYLRLQGDGLSVGGYETNPIFWEEVSDKFAFGLFDLDWDVFTQHIEGAINRVPVLAKTGVKSTVCGPESFTPDHKPLMGEAPELRGFFLGCGFNSAGMMLGGGCGQELAHWIVHGRPEKDMYGYDIRRFHHSLTDHRRWVRERSHESYAKNYSVVFPHDEPLAGRNMRRDPLHEELLARGCVFQERHGWERPGWFHPGGPAPVLHYDYYGAYGHRAHQDYAYSRLLEDDYTFDFPPHHHVPLRSRPSRGRSVVWGQSTAPRAPPVAR